MSVLFDDPRAQMPIDAMLRAAADMRLPGFEHLLADQPQIRPSRRDDVARAAAQVFSTPEGRKVLEHLFDVTVRRPLVMPELARDPVTLYPLACKREGENALVLYLAKLAHAGLGQDPQ